MAEYSPIRLHIKIIYDMINHRLSFPGIRRCRGGIIQLLSLYLMAILYLLILYVEGTSALPQLWWLQM